MEQLLLTLKEELIQKINRDIWPRHISLPNVTDKIQVLTGMRRTGKTFFLLGMIKELLKTINEQSILYINFEDDRLLPLDQAGLANVIDTFFQLFPENHDRRCFLFFDEIQNVDGWPLVLRRIFDTKDVQIYITGSSAKMLSKEISTSLRGRNVNTEIWPLDFLEYPGRVNYPLEMGNAAFDKFNKDLREFMSIGGFPEVIDYDHITRINVLQDYVEVVIYRDIIERYHITNISLVKYLIKTIMHSSGRQLSIHKLYNDLKSQGIKIGKNTLYDYLSYIEDCYLAFTVPLYNKSIRVVQANPKKIYAVDTGLIKAYTLYQHDEGNFFENLVYLTLRRNNFDIYYFITEQKYEVDFLVKDYLGNLKFFQACYDMKNKNTSQREQRALKAAMEELNIPGEIITPLNYLKFLNTCRSRTCA